MDSAGEGDAAPPGHPEYASDIRSARILPSGGQLRAQGRRAVSIVALVVIDLSGLAGSLYLALVLRELYYGERPILWGLPWDAEKNWLPFLALVTVLVFWRAGLYAAREQRGGAGRIVSSLLLVMVITLAFALGTGYQHTTFGLYVDGVRDQRDRDLAAPLQLRGGHGGHLAGRGRAAPRGSRRRRRAARRVAPRARARPRRDRLRVRRRPLVQRRRVRPAGARRSHGSPARARGALPGRADRQRHRPRRGRAARPRPGGAPRGRQGADRADDRGAAAPARRVRRRPGRAALRAASARLHRPRLGGEARVRRGRQRAADPDRAARSGRSSRCR